MKKEIITLTDIKLLVDTFYGKVRSDELLSGIFNDVIKENWPVHLEKMYRFWQTILLDEHTYHGSPFPRHAGLPINKLHFDRWLTLFYETVDELFSGEKAAEAKERSSNMAKMFLYKLESIKANGLKPVI